MAVGYDDHNQRMLMRNSWGWSWGIKGYFWMPYDYITNPRVTADFWTIRGVTPRGVVAARPGSDARHVSCIPLLYPRQLFGIQLVVGKLRR